MKVLSVEHSLAWSWGLVIESLIAQSSHEFVRIIRPKKTVAKDLLHGYNVVLAQNAETMRRLEVLDNTVVRMAGMHIDKRNPAQRHNGNLLKVAAVIATNRQLYDIAKAVNEHTVLIPNGVDLQLFRPDEERTDRRFTIGFAGNITSYGGFYKGWQYYNAAFISLWNQVDHRECLHGAPDNHRQGQIEHADMPQKFYHKIDCLILPTINEGCSNVISEALACGVVVICTKVGYHGDTLTHGKNVLFVERDTQDIYDKVMMLITDPHLVTRLRKNGRDFVERNQDVTEIARRYDEVITSILE